MQRRSRDFRHVILLRVLGTYVGPYGLEYGYLGLLYGLYGL